MKKVKPMAKKADKALDEFLEAAFAGEARALTLRRDGTAKLHKATIDNTAEDRVNQRMRELASALKAQTPSRAAPGWLQGYWAKGGTNGHS